MYLKRALQLKPLQLPGRKSSHAEGRKSLHFDQDLQPIMNLFIKLTQHYEENDKINEQDLFWCFTTGEKHRKESSKRKQYLNILRI